MSEENGSSGESQLKIYISSVSSNREVKHQQQRIFLILDSKKIIYEKIDIAANEDDKNKMRDSCGDPKAMPPRFFCGEDYIGDFQAFDDAVEGGDLNSFLKL